jgi:glyoxalase family protein
MSKISKGIHHITAIVGDPQQNIDFYAGVLGLRLIKQTVNFDDSNTYHLYFGDYTASPGTLITFFPWIDGQMGKVGGGQVKNTTYIIPAGAFEFWKKRLTNFSVAYQIVKRFNETFLEFKDPHGLTLELVEREGGSKNIYQYDDITSAVAIKGFGGAVLSSIAYLQTKSLLLNTMGLTKVNENEQYIRFLTDSNIGNYIDLVKQDNSLGVMGVGVVHHIAWRALDDNDHLDWLKHIKNDGYQPTPVIDRNYFHSIYFRERGGILFEIATDGPGFTIDESLETLGLELQLPKQYQPYRKEIEASLPKLKIKI